MATHEAPPTDLNAPHLKDGSGHAHVEMSIDAENPIPEMSNLTMMDPRVPRRPVLSPRSTSPTGSVRSTFTASRRRISRGFSYNSTMSRQRSAEFSKELSAQAEGEFFALTELVSSMSRRSMSLREVWSKIVAERDACYVEMDRMEERFEEFTEIIERKDKELQQNNQHKDESKKDVVKVRLELTAAANSVSDYKSKLAVRDNECKSLRHEVAELKDNLGHVRMEYDEAKKTSEKTRLALVASESSRGDLEDKFGKLRGEREALDLRLTDVSSRHEELSTKYESSSKELLQIKQSNTTLKKEKHDLLLRESDLGDKLRKSEHKHDELRRKFHDVETHAEKKTQEVKELHELIIKVRQEKDELETHIARLKRELDDEHGKWEDAEERCNKWKLSFERSERELSSLRDDFTRLEISISELNETINKKTEDYRMLVIEKKRVDEDYDRATTRADENHRQLILVGENLSQAEASLRKAREELHSKSERIERLELDQGLTKGRIEELEVQIQSSQALAASLKVNIDGLNNECGDLKEKCRDWEGKYEEIRETVEDFEEGSSGYEHEVFRLRGLLAGAASDTQKAIAARQAADGERDKYIALYEQKCRDVLAYEESVSMQMQEQQRRRSSGKITRTYTKTSHAMGSGEHSYHESHSPESL